MLSSLHEIAGYSGLAECSHSLQAVKTLHQDEPVPVRSNLNGRGLAILENALGEKTIDGYLVQARKH